MIDFPDNPQNGDEFLASNGITYIFNGKTWTRSFNTKVQPTASIHDIENVETEPMSSHGHQYLTNIGGIWTKSQNLNLYPKVQRFFAYSSVFFYPPTEQYQFWAPYDTIYIDTENSYDIVNYEYTIPTSGYWQIHATCHARDLREYSKMGFYVNGSWQYNIGSQVDGASAYEIMIHGGTFQHFNSGDILRIYHDWYGHYSQIYHYGGLSTHFCGELIESDGQQPS